jgi:glutamate carboxypeptidase
MVAINSFTTNINGVNELGRFTAEAFAPLGFVAEYVPAKRSDHGAHLVLRRMVDPAAPTCALISHLDTVFSEAEEQRNQFHWRVEGDRIHGPGTNDIKGGTTAIWLLLHALRSESPALYEGTNWIVLLNSCEEVDSSDFGDLCRNVLPATTRACLVFEGDGGSGDQYLVVAARKGRATFEIEVSGRGAHAGSDHRRGSNAVVQMAELITRVSAFTDYERGVTVNVGSTHGGTVTNRVPHHALARLEMRSFSTEVFRQTEEKIMALAGDGSVRSAIDGHPCKVVVRSLDETGPWPPNEATNRLVEIWEQTGRELGMNISHEHRGGLSDGNVIWNLFPTIDGLGPRGEDCHCSERSEDGSKEQEWVDVTSFVPKTVLNALCIERLLEK